MTLDFLCAATSPLDSLGDQGGYVIFALLILTGAGLIIHAFFKKLEPHVRNRHIIIGSTILCAMLAAALQTRVDKERGFVADQEKRYDEKLKEITRKKGKDEALKLQYMYMPAGNSLSFMTLNNPSLAADYVWLTSLQFVSNSFRRGEKFDMLMRFHKTMSDLDPHWVDAQINGAKVLSALIEEREKAEQTYLYDIEKNIDNPNDLWKLRYEAGLLYVMPPNDPNKMAEFSRRSAQYFTQAVADERHFPKELLKATNDRIARLQMESGSTFYQEAEKILAQNATASDTPETLRDISRRDWMKARSMAMSAFLTDEVAAFKKLHGSFPPNLNPILATLPKPDMFATDAYDYPFDYDPATGEVTSRGAKALRAVQSLHVVNDLLSIYKERNEGRCPKDLIEFRTFVRNCKEEPFHPASVMVIEAIGKNFDPTVGPLGPWTYDAAKGEVIPPVECNIKALYGHVNDYDWKPSGITKIKR
ncbi:MAG: hypothetical protein WCT04_08890 [Planctomycetota bacterium]